jgi:epoxyqueuosine reductase
MMGIVDAFAARHGCIAGVCDAAPLPRAPYEATGFVPFVSKDLEKRTNPAATLPGVQSIVVVGVGHGTEGENAERALLRQPEDCAEISSLGQAEDYHIRIKGLLLELVKELRKHYTFRHKALVDSPGLDERALAVRAGLGFYGRHGLVISREYGSRFNIGCLLTDIPLTAPLHNDPANRCPPGCQRCIAACPTGALAHGHKFNVARCISYLTQKDTLTPQELSLLGNQLYGCDICQDACPRNAPRVKTTVHPADWLAMSDDDFARAYGHTAMLWQGAERLRRNARKDIPHDG